MNITTTGGAGVIGSAFCWHLVSNGEVFGGLGFDDIVVSERTPHAPSSKIESHLGWRPRGNFETCPTHTIAWYLGNEWWWKPIRECTYAGARLGRLAAAQ
jgi:dTDP-D-glucose 4,6-dehydratase